MKTKLSQKILTGFAFIANLLLATQLQARETQLCEQLRNFLQASTTQESRVELSMFWGVRTEGNRITLSERLCNHSDGKAEKQLCAYLLPHSSSEFPDLNFRRAVKCLQGYDPFDSNTSLTVRDIKLNFYEPKLVDFPVEVELELKRKEDVMLMRISTKRDKHEQK